VSVTSGPTSMSLSTGGDRATRARHPASHAASTYMSARVHLGFPPHPSMGSWPPARQRRRAPTERVDCPTDVPQMMLARTVFIEVPGSHFERSLAPPPLSTSAVVIATAFGFCCRSALLCRAASMMTDHARCREQATITPPEANAPLARRSEWSRWSVVSPVGRGTQGETMLTGPIRRA
jgi:hypothetical protein